MAGTLEDLPVQNCTVSPSQSPFQLQTSSIRNSTPFKAKSADVFGSLETIERDYNSAVSGRGLVADGRGGAYDDADEEEGRLEGFIKRGCIFGKPPGSSGDLHQQETLASQTGTHSSHTGLDKKASSHSSIKSLETLQSDKRMKSPAATSSSLLHPDAPPSSSDDKTAFRKPNKHPMSRDMKQVDTGRSGGSGFDLRFALRGRRHTADHMLNPQKYTKYSLEETSMCGNSANRSIALGFLNQLRKRKVAEGEDQASREGSTEGQFVFKRPIPSKGTEEWKVEHPAMKKAYGGVYRMPEYEVGKGSGLKHKKPKLTYSAKEQEQTGNVEVGNTSQMCTRPVYSLDHVQSEQPITSKMHLGVGHSTQSKISREGGNAETHQSDHGEPTCIGGTSFKNRKGKGRRQFRGKQEHEEDT